MEKAMKTDDQPKSSNFADLLKFIMSIFVVAIHAHFLKGNEIADMLISDVFGRIAVPFFFTAAAFFLFRHIDEPTFGKRVARYLTKMGLLYIICTFIYVPAIIDWNKGKVSLFKWFKLIFFEGSYRQLWFLPALVFAVALVYALCRMGISTKVIFAFSVPLYIVGCAFHSFYKPLITFEFIDEFAKGYYNIFGTTRNGIFFGFIYVALGALLATHSLKLKKPVAWLCLIASTAIMIIEVLIVEEFSVRPKGMGMYLSVFFVALFLFWISVNTKFLSGLPDKPFKVLRKLSTYIYFSHTFFLYIFSDLSYNREFFAATVASVLFGLFIIGLQKISKLINLRKLLSEQREQ